VKIALGKKPLAGEPDTRRIYDYVAVEEVTLLDLLRLERESSRLGRPLTLHALSEMEASITQAQIAAVAKAPAGQEGAAKRLARESHPDAPWLYAVMIWACQRAAGVDVSFESAIDVPPNEIDVISELGDPEDEPDPTRRPPAKSGGGKPRAKGRSTKRTSNSQFFSD
jgi:hypothetical protein